MGRDKTRLPYRGQPMALFQADKLAFVCGRAALVGKDPEGFPGSPWPYVEDGAVPVAAALGVVAALSWSPEDANLVLAADLPRVSDSFLAALLELAQTTEAPALAPTVEGRVQPLCAVYRKRALVPLARRVAAGQYGLIDALDEMGAVVLTSEETAELPGSEPERFLNVNTPEDYEGIEEETRPYASGRRRRGENG
jgi:molybdopterin-guanine dinucleotide biosynthesis protein A